MDFIEKNIIIILNNQNNTKIKKGVLFVKYMYIKLILVKKDTCTVKFIL
jgi:hypothetical protein